MFLEHHLNLGSVRLKTADQSSQKREGLSFLFIKQGTGKVTSGSYVRPIAPGDVIALKGGTTGNISAENRGELEFWGFSLALEQLFPLFGAAEISHVHDVSEGFNTAKVYPASSPVATKCQGLLAGLPKGFGLDHRSQLLRVAAALLEEKFKNVPPPRAGFVRIE